MCRFKQKVPIGALSTDKILSTIGKYSKPSPIRNSGRRSKKLLAEEEVALRKAEEEYKKQK